MPFRSGLLLLLLVCWSYLTVNAQTSDRKRYRQNEDGNCVQVEADRLLKSSRNPLFADSKCIRPLKLSSRRRKSKVRSTTKKYQPEALGSLSEESWKTETSAKSSRSIGSGRRKGKNGRNAKKKKSRRNLESEQIPSNEALPYNHPVISPGAKMPDWHPVIPPGAKIPDGHPPIKSDTNAPPEHAPQPSDPEIPHGPGQSKEKPQCKIPGKHGKCIDTRKYYEFLKQSKLINLFHPVNVPSFALSLLNTRLKGTVGELSQRFAEIVKGGPGKIVEQLLSRCPHPPEISPFKPQIWHDSIVDC